MWWLNVLWAHRLVLFFFKVRNGETDAQGGIFIVCNNMMMNPGIPRGQHSEQTQLKISKNIAVFTSTIGFKYQ